MTRRPRLFVTWGRTPPTTCPHCRSTLRSTTGLSPEQPVRPTPGSITLCDECGTWSVFAADMSLRLATADEVDEIDPELRQITTRLVEALAARERKH